MLVKNTKEFSKYGNFKLIVEEMVKEVEELVKQVDTPTYKTFELKKKKKAELLEIANDLNCSVTIKNTKAQIIKAIEKQSA